MLTSLQLLGIGLLLASIVTMLLSICVYSRLWYAILAASTIILGIGATAVGILT